MSARDDARDYKGGRALPQHLHVVFVDSRAKLWAAVPSVHHGFRDRHVGSFVQADDGNERVGFLVDAEHAACVIHEGGSHATVRAIV